VVNSIFTFTIIERVPNQTTQSFCIFLFIVKQTNHLIRTGITRQFQYFFSFRISNSSKITNFVCGEVPHFNPCFFFHIICVLMRVLFVERSLILIFYLLFHISLRHIDLVIIRSHLFQQEVEVSVERTLVP